MTPREKAAELVLKFAFKGAQHEGEAKTFALIAVDELIYETHFEVPNIRQRWWQEVKKEIELL
jgi:hypothetical protein